MRGAKSGRDMRVSLRDPSDVMPDPLQAEAALSRTLGIIMGGGAGKRLYPLTKDRSKPAVPLGGKYRLVDIPISNCLNAGIRGI